MIKIIYPIDPTIPRIKRHAEHISRQFGDVCKRIVLTPHDSAKTFAHNEIEKSKDDDLLVFMGHGRSDALFGGRGRFFNAEGLTGDSSLDDNPDIYNDENFIDSHTYSLFKGKKLVCKACNSNLLGEKLVDSGAVAVLGFGKLPTTREELEDDWHYNSPSKHAAPDLAGIFEASFERAFIRVVKWGGNFADLAYAIKAELYYQSSLMLCSHTRYRHRIADILYAVEKSVIVIGDSRVRLLG